MSSSYTCITCGVAFKNPDTQRQHYKTDWHRYNLKRKVAELPVVTAEEFEQRVLKQRFLDTETARDKSVYCLSCKKNFFTTKSFENHLNSKKHKEKMLNEEKEKKKIVQKFSKVKVTETNENNIEKSDIETDSEIEEISSDEWNENDKDNPVNKNNCLFCNLHSRNLVVNLKHMSETHSFFIPDVEYCVDIKGLLLHLGAKLFYEHICLWCNGKSFQSIQAVQKHMIDKGHTNLLHEGEALAEYSSYYDYSSSYPDNDEGVDPDEEVVVPVLDDTDYQLVLPSGSVIGHRSLMRYYKQNLDPKRGMMVQRKINQILSSYKTYGYSPVQKEIAQRKARDIRFFSKMHQKFSVQLGCKSNKLQKHFRPQVISPSLSRLQCLKNFNMDDIVYTLIYPERYNDVIQHLRYNFFADEPLNRSLSLCKPGQPHEELEEFSLGVISQGVSFMGVLSTTGEVVGVLLNGHESGGKNSDKKCYKDQKLQKIFDFLGSVDKDVDFLTHYNARNILELKILSVDMKFRGRGIAGRLYEITEKFAQSKGFTLLRTDATALFSQKVFQKYGFTSLKEIIYDEYPSKDAPLFIVEAPHVSFKLMVKKLQS